MAPLLTDSSSPGLGHPAAAPMSDGILAIAPSSFFMLAHPRNGRERSHLKSFIK